MTGSAANSQLRYLLLAAILSYYLQAQSPIYDTKLLPTASCELRVLATAAFSSGPSTASVELALLLPNSGLDGGILVHAT